MSDIIFCKTRYQDIGYHSYNDFWQMVKWAGYPIIYVDQLNPHSDNTYIFTPMNGECINGWDNPSAEIILWQMEWQLTNEHNAPKGVKRVWCSDAAFATRNGYEYIPMGGDSRLNECPDLNPSKVYEVAQLSYQTPRRQVITRQLQEQGLTLAPNSGLWGSVRSTVLQQSQVMLHTHQEEATSGIAPLRWCLAAAHGLPLITESVPDRGIFTPSYMTQADYPFLAQFTAHMLKDKQMLADYALNLHNLLCVDYTFRDGVEKHV